MNKKITLAQWTEIGKYNCASKWLRPLCKYTLYPSDGGNFRREQKIGWFAYLLLFIPLHILQFFYCCWDGGLKEFEIQPRFLSYDELEYGSEPWERAEKIYNSL